MRINILSPHDQTNLTHFIFASENTIEIWIDWERTAPCPLCFELIAINQIVTIRRRIDEGIIWGVATPGILFPNI